MQWHPQILADQLTLSQPEETDYAHLITTGTPGFSDLPTALTLKNEFETQNFEIFDKVVHNLGKPDEVII